MKSDKTKVTLKWTPPKDDGGNDIFNYVVEYRSEGAFRWKCANEDERCPMTTFTIQNLSDDTQYEFRVAAQNSAGVGPYSETTMPVAPKEKPSGSMPSITTRLRDVKVIAPQKATLTCEVEPGEPKAKIHWYKDSKEIYPGRKHEVTYEGTTATLVISPTEFSDTATYRIEAENKLARVESEAKLIVQGEHSIMTIIV